MLAVFGGFEREMIVARVNAGIARAKTHGTKSGRAIGRPMVSKATEAAIRDELAKGTGIVKTGVSSESGLASCSGSQGRLGRERV